MQIMTNKTIASIFRTFADKIENGTCAVDVETLTDIANNLIHIKLNAEQTCSYLNVSRATLTRMVCDGRVPNPHKDRGGDKYWYQDELDDYTSRYKEKYGL
jgi:predicted DNA-binding transcriptional regulator AlpA